MKEEIIYLKKMKHGQVGETLTWLVGTLIILVVLIFAIYLVNVGGIVKGLDRKAISYAYATDRIAGISLNSYLLTDKNGEAIYKTIRRDGNLNKENGPLALQIFNDYYKEDYQEVWLGVTTLDQGIGGSTYNGRSNDYFGGKPRTIASDSFGNVAKKDSWFHPRWTKDNEYVSLFFVGKQIK